MKTRKVWVCRRPYGEGAYELWTMKPTLNEFGSWARGDGIHGFLVTLCMRYFHAFGGPQLEPGTCKQFEMSLGFVEVTASGKKSKTSDSKSVSRRTKK